MRMETLKRPNSIRGLHSNKITLIAVICNVRYRREMSTNAEVGNFLSNTKHNKLRSPQNLPEKIAVNALLVTSHNYNLHIKEV